MVEVRFELLHGVQSNQLSHHPPTQISKEVVDLAKKHFDCSPNGKVSTSLSWELWMCPDVQEGLHTGRIGFLPSSIKECEEEVRCDPPR